MRDLWGVERPRQRQQRDSRLNPLQDVRSGFHLSGASDQP
jgi:hypothetical protein